MSDQEQFGRPWRRFTRILADDQLLYRIAGKFGGLADRPANRQIKIRQYYM
jgi:hypothetical protein